MSAGVAELVDARDLKSLVGFLRVGSSPTLGILAYRQIFLLDIKVNMSYFLIKRQQDIVVDSKLVRLFMLIKLRRAKRGILVLLFR